MPTQTVKAKSMLRSAQRMFAVFNRDKNLSYADRRHLKALYMQRTIGREEFQSMKAREVSSAVQRLGGRLLNAGDIEALTGIDKKTIYCYVAAGTIPHVRILSNIRFWEDEISQWLRRQSHRPTWMKRKRKSLKARKK